MHYLYAAKIGALGLAMVGEYYAFLPPRTQIPNNEDRKVFGKADVITAVAKWCPYLVLVSFPTLRNSAEYITAPDSCDKPYRSGCISAT